MSIYLNKDSRIIVQGITGGMGAKHTALMLDSGATIVGGVNARKAGTTVTHKDHQGNDVELPVFGTVKEAMAETGADVSVLFVPPAFTKAACVEAIDAEMPLIVVITEGVPVQDTAEIWSYLRSAESNKGGTRMIGPNCPGIITPGACKIGIMPGHIHKPGKIAIVSRSGTLTYEAVKQTTDAGLGQSTVIGIGGDPMQGMNFIDCLRLFQDDAQTEGIIMVGEIGGSAEEEAAEFIAAHVTKPVVGFIAGASAPEGKRMGHAGAIASGGQGTAEGKFAAMEAAGVTTVRSPGDLGAAIKARLG
jgi:succinyl-CoA synthetase alpha subunit